MAIAFDAATTGTAANAASLTFSHTVGAGGVDRFLTVGVSFQNRVVNGVTYAGTAMVSVGTLQNGVARMHLWQLVAPATGANNVVITMSGGGVAIVGIAVSYTGVHQTTSLGTFASASGNSTAVTVDIASAVNDLVIDCVGTDGAGTPTLTVGAGQTQRGNADAGNTLGAGSTEPGAATVTMSWTRSAAAVWATGGVSIKPAAGGTQFTQAVTGALSFSGPLANQTGKVLSGSLSFAGALVKQVSRALTGGLTFAGALAKQVGKVLAGAVSFAGAMTAAKIVLKAIEGILSFAGALAKQTGKPMAGVLSFSGAIVKQPLKVLTGAVSFAGAMTKQAGKALAGVVSFAGVLSATKLILKALVGVLDFVGAIVRQTGKPLSGSLTFAGTVAITFVKLLVGSLAFAGAAVKRTARALTGSLDFTRLLEIVVPEIKGTGGLTSLMDSAKSRVKKIFNA